jgi:hypothetical protein
MLHWILDFLFKIIFMTAFYCFAVRQCFKSVKIRILEARSTGPATNYHQETYGDRSGAVQHCKVVHMQESFLLYEKICESFAISEEGFPQKYLCPLFL